MFAVKVTAEPGAASAGAARVNIVASPVTCSGIFWLLGKKAPSPRYCAVTVWIPTSVKLALTAAAPLAKGAVPKLVDPSRNVTVPVGFPVLPGPAATLAAIVTVVPAEGVRRGSLITTNKPVGI